MISIRMINIKMDLRRNSDDTMSKLCKTIIADVRSIIKTGNGHYGSQQHSIQHKRI
jgi:hypothetical protein